MKTAQIKNQEGFTLIELLVVIGVLTVLLSITLVAINPQRQIQLANDTQRRSDVNALLNAVHQYATDNNGSVPAGITSTAKTVTNTAGVTNIDLCALLVPTYLADLPLDPSTGTEDPADSLCSDVDATYNTGYTVSTAGAGNRVEVCATGQVTTTICVTR